MAPQNTEDGLPHEGDNNEPEIENERALKAGRILASPAPGEEILVTGMAGRFPDSDDVYHYRFNLFNKVDMVSYDNRRWEPNHPEIPQRTGKINFIEKFDAGFFGVHYRQAHAMDPMCRQILERAFEAVLDAGYHPDQLRGTNTGIFVGACFSETEKTWFYDKLETPVYGITGCTRSMIAQRVSYYMGLEGPSVMVDTACSSSLYALEHAYRAIRSGRCEAALVGGSNLCLHPFVSLQFARLGVLSLDGSCKSFDADANGYARSETVACIFLQKSKDSRRVYAQMLHAKANCDGYKEQGITYPSGTMQRQLLDEIYQESNINPATIDFLEAHATGTKVGDPEEIMAMDEVFCTANRKTPLYIGSIKSNLGHTEPASGLCSVVKVLLGMENSCLLPNLNYTHPREGAEALEKGRMIVVTEKMPWPENGSGLAAVNSFGFGGANCHVVFKRFMKQKVNEGLPRDDLPRLVCLSARTEEGVAFALDDVCGRTLDVEYVRLIQESFGEDIMAHPHRGYILMSKTGEVSRSMQWYDGVRKPLCMVFGGANEECLSIGSQLFKIPLFAATIQRIHNVLSPKGINLADIINGEAKKDIVSTIVGSVAIQIALVDILKTLELSHDYVIGCSIGELVAGYVDGALTLEQAVLSAYCIGQCMSDANKTGLSSYNVELSKDQIQSIPSDIEIIGHNAEKNFTIAGPTHKVVQFVDDLKKRSIAVEEVQNYCGLHSKQLAQIRPKLVHQLKDIIPKPKVRTGRWISASISKSQSTSEIAKYGSAEYFANNILSPVLLKEATTMIPPKSALLDIGTNFANHDDFATAQLVAQRDGKNDVNSFLKGLGRLYEIGYNPKFEKLYPKVQWPVSLGTPMISPLIKWNHTEDWFVALYKAQERMKSGERILSLTIKETDWAFLAGHVIDGRNLIPATYYLIMIWETYSMMMGLLLSDMQIVFENVRFHRATGIPKTGTIELVLMIQKTTGIFEVAEPGQPICSGRIYIPDNFDDEVIQLPVPIGEAGPISLTSKDIYKELKLRGYNYMGVFRGLKECDLSATIGKINWIGNWIPFIDSMLQIKLLQEDTRSLYIPTGIERLAIDARAHIRYAKEFGENPNLPVYFHQETAIIKSGGIELRCLYPLSIPRRKALGEPVLESHKFIPYDVELSTEHSIRINSQIFLENNYGMKLRIVELIDAATRTDATPLGPLIHQAFSDQPLIQPEVVVMSKEPLELTNVTVEDKKLTAETHSCSIVIVSDAVGRPEIREQALNALKDHNGCILSRQNLDFDPEIAAKDLEDFSILAVHTTDQEKIILLRKSVEFVPPTIIDVSKRMSFDWLPTLQTALKNDEKLLILAQNEPLSGILGFVNCLRREPGGMPTKCVFIVDDNAPQFDVENDVYLKQLKKGLAVNIYKDGKWGSYRHLLLEEAGLVEREHIFNNVTVRGDLSSLRWIEGPLTSNSVLAPEKILVHIYYASLNFRDIMTASGRISNDVVTRDRLEQYNVQGFEFSGRDSTGRRVMGMVTSGALASMVTADSYLMWEIPESWSMEDAATIPVTYGTVMHAVVMVAQIKPGESILIHAGTGGIGQAAINIALSKGCVIFTTVGMQEKRDFIRETFPQIPESHIGNSRDTSFEQMIMRETNGRGVDVVLNSLAEEKLQASIRCLAPGGRFLEIGKFDLANNNTIGLKKFTKDRQFHGVMVDGFFKGPPQMKENMGNLITKGLEMGWVKPLSRTIFKEDEVEQAFRFMAGGKHIGKIIIKLREEEPELEILPEFRLFKGIPRFYGNPDKSYIISGGLGGFGLELADWMVLRGARKLVLVSRTGLKTGYQASRIRIWKTYGVITKISTANITTHEGCMAIIKEANEMGPVEGIFNLAVVLKDALFENQNEDNYITSLGPKALATQYLDIVSRDMCPELLYFVVFSSVSCGRGNIGQTNYGMANSIMERICEIRKQDGYPALAIQWGAIGEVGLVAEMQELQTEIEIGGTLQQRVTSCLEVMDTLLKQNEPVVASMVVAEKRGGAGGADNIVDAVKNIMGLKDLKTISLHATLSELGMDSMMAVEIKQTLEREYEVFLTAQDIRSMTFARLKEIEHERATESENQSNKQEDKEKMPRGIQLLLRTIGEEEHAYTPIMRLTSLIKEKAVAPKAFLLPGVEGMASIMEPLAANLASHALCLQYIYGDNPEKSIEEIAKTLISRVQENLPKVTPFTLIGYSYGALVALELASLLEQEGRIGRVILIDGAPTLFRELIKRQAPEVLESEPLLETLTLCALMELYIPLEVVATYKNEIFECRNFEERVDCVLSHAPENTPHSEKYQRQVCITSYVRVRSSIVYKPAFRKLKSMVKLFKPSRPTIEDYDEDYKMQQLIENPMEVTIFEGNHLTILKNPQVAYAINNIIDTSSVYFKQSIMKDKAEVETLKEVSIKQI